MKHRHMEVPAAGGGARWRLAWALSLAVLLAGCASTQHRESAPGFKVPPLPRDITAIPNAVPRFEPRAPHGNPPFYDIAGKRYYVLATAEGYDATGVASWYGPTFDGLRTADGDRYDMYAMTAAHKTLPLPCYVRVTNLANGRSIVVKVNDRGPFVANRLIDLSYVAAAKLDMLATGTTLVEVQAITPENPVELTRAAESPPPTLYLQVGAYAVEAHAERVVARLHAAGLAGAFVFGPPVAVGNLYRVRIGPVSGVPEFDRLVARLAALGYPGARLVAP
ncbi:MAG TPA: septal ring lytic transglycosylase RlpA family protein [Steroidobacteraceae bacterium]|nr:septal ring lytic transglycosylase RlpA family protein [Steroidobacteraceae bacterium]